MHKQEEKDKDGVEPWDNKIAIVSFRYMLHNGLDDQKHAVRMGR
jgi:hypothetical protein